MEGINASSNIDVRGLVNQLMTLERRPLNQLQSRESQLQSRLSAFGRVQGALSSLETSLETLRRDSTFSAGKASVSGEGVAAATSGSAAAGRYSIAISQLARSQTMASAPFANATTSIGSGNVTLRSADGSTVLGTVAIGDSGTGTLTELRDEINALDIGVRASLVNDGGATRIALVSRDSGAANGFTVSTDAGLSGLALSTTQTAQNAQYSFNGLALSSASNTIENVVDGLTITLTKAPPAGSAPGTTVDAEVSVERDPEGIRNRVADFVKAYNDVEKLVDDLTRYNTDTRTGAVLNGESTVRQIQQRLRSMVTESRTGASGELTRLSEVGITLDRDGTMKLDEARLTEAVTGGASAVAKLFTQSTGAADTQGFAVRLGELVSGMADADGLLASRQDGLRSSVRSLGQQKERIEARLAQTEQRLLREYAKLDALLSSRQNQSSGLASALAGVPINR
jgi:flagellar hook-associated protein 2